VRGARHPAGFTVIAIAVLACTQLLFAQVSAEFHRTLTVTPAEPLRLDIDVPSGDLQIFYGRDGQVSISGAAKTSASAKLDDNFFPAALRIEQNGNHLSLRHVPNLAFSEKGIQVSYRIDVPYRTEVTSTLNRGEQNISGILGPVIAVTGTGDIKASYVSKGLQAQVGTGNLDIQVIGGRVEARTRNGNISCTRAALGVSAETGDGDITLMVIGPSTATVKKGTGRIEVGGARGSFVGSTDEGDLHVRAIPRDDWQLSSASGNIRLDLPPVANLELHASTDSGAFQFDRDDIARPDADLHHFRQKIGGGKQIEVHTRRGKIVIR
jgi:hypothetical protein